MADGKFDPMSPLRAAVAESKENTLHCSFCGKSEHDVKVLIAGPRVHICNECVELCTSIVNSGGHVNVRFGSALRLVLPPHQFDALVRSEVGADELLRRVYGGPEIDLELIEDSAEEFFKKFEGAIHDVVEEHLNTDELALEIALVERKLEYLKARRTSGQP